MTPWVRFCSYGAGREFEDNGDPVAKKKPGFVFFGGKDFYSGYGFKGTGPAHDTIIGYMPQDGTPHTITYDLNESHYPIHVPPPEIEKIQVTIQRELFRRASVEWVCFSRAQLEYMTPYFLVPGITCVLEWGWNHYNNEVLLDLSDTNKMKELNNNPYPLYTDHILKSKGNYDVLFGKVTHFEWSIDGNKIKCRTEITSQDRIYAGLVIDSNSVQRPKNASNAPEKKDQPLDNLPEFIANEITKLKNLIAKDPTSISPDINSFVQYLIKHHPNNWKEYLYGVFWGRNMEVTEEFKSKIASPIKQPIINNKYDFDKTKNTIMWINMGLLVEIMNYHSAPLTGFKDKEMFRIEVDDCVISGHPNMISTNGNILLIPNWEAPHYHYGRFANTENDPKESAEMKPADKETPVPLTNDANKVNKADRRVLEVMQSADVDFICRRDDLDEEINWLRYKYAGSERSFEFPFSFDQSPDKDSNKPYPKRYSGYLKDLYVNVKLFAELASKDSGIKTYAKLIEKILERVNAACGNFWDFRLIGGWGKQNLPKNEPSTMKISDYKFMATLNRGSIYTFDYLVADSLLLGMNFKPTLSNAAAIRTIYAPTNNPNKPNLLTNGEDEMLNYHFKDLLMSDEDLKKTQDAVTVTRKNDETIKKLQKYGPAGDIESFQMSDGKVIRRLVLPAPDILKLMLDDGDEDNNPKYTGIMPNIQATFTIQGIGGLRTFMCFLVRNLPEPYSHEDIVFRIINLEESIEHNQWTTTITAGIIPLRDFIRQRLGIPPKVKKKS